VAEVAFGPRLRQLREAAGLSQKALADVVGFQVGAISRLERGIRGPSWDTVRALCRALDVPCSAFETEDDPSATEAAPRPRGRPRRAASGPSARPTSTKARGKRR
jgi:transcriptional regulator with XRE-family HTH domain